MKELTHAILMFIYKHENNIKSITKIENGLESNFFRKHDKNLEFIHLSVVKLEKVELRKLHPPSSFNKDHIIISSSLNNYLLNSISYNCNLDELMISLKYLMLNAYINQCPFDIMGFQTTSKGESFIYNNDLDIKYNKNIIGFVQKNEISKV